MWRYEVSELHHITMNYFAKLYTSVSYVGQPLFNFVQRKVTVTQNELLMAPIEVAEVRKALFDMHPDKVPRIDGMNPAFFQNFWHIIGTDVVLVCRQFFAIRVMPYTLKNIALIPKKNNHRTMSELRPIALCKIVYKAIAKVISNRLKIILPILFWKLKEHSYQEDSL